MTLLAGVVHAALVLDLGLKPGNANTLAWLTSCFIPTVLSVQSRKLAEVPEVVPTQRLRSINLVYGEKRLSLNEKLPQILNPFEGS